MPPEGGGGGFAEGTAIGNGEPAELPKPSLDGTAVAEWAASPRGVLKFRPHSVGIAIDLVCTCQGRSDIAVYRSS